MDWLDVEIKKIPGLTWTPVRTKSRQEKKLAQYCELQSVITYLPLKKRMKRYQRRMVETFIPMFPGYVFCALDEEGYNAILPSGTIVYRINMTPALEERLIEDLIALRDMSPFAGTAERHGVVKALLGAVPLSVCIFKHQIVVEVFGAAAVKYRFGVISGEVDLSIIKLRDM